MEKQRGSMTVLGMIMILLLSSISATLVLLCHTHLQIATNHRDGIAAQYWAEAGLEEAVATLKTNREFVSQTQLGNQVITMDSYTVQTGPPPHSTATNMRLIIATGTVNKVQRQIIAHITLPNPDDQLKKFVIIRNFREGEYFGT